MKASNWIQQADQAMNRAAARARAVAANTHTALHFMKDGKIVEIRPAKEVRYPLSAEFQEQPDLSFVREHPPPYGDQKPCAESPNT